MYGQTIINLHREEKTYMTLSQKSILIFVHYDVILTFKGVGVSWYDVSQYFYCQNLSSIGLSEIVLNEHLQILV